MTHTFTSELATTFASVALGHVTREWPNKLDHVLDGPEDVKGPRALHPIFYGSFDWHSCVHSHWLLARIYRRFPDGAQAANIRKLFDEQFTREKVAGEIAYLARPSARGFERPYGWAWALMLQGELVRHTTDEGENWAVALKPLADAFVQRFRDFLPLATYPVRSGVHSSTSFALLLALDYAKAAGDTAFADLLKAKARDWHMADVNANLFEPSQSDFLSPTLIEAALMQAVLGTMAFRGWFAGFLPRAADGEPATLFTSANVSDRSDGQIAHLDGLNLSRAWCWHLIVDRLTGGDPLRARINTAIDTQLTSALDHIAGDYMGEHWLASFALLALDPHEPRVLPADNEIRTERLVLRRMTMDDAPALHAIYSDPETMKYWSSLPHADVATTRAHVTRTIAAIESGDGDDFVITLDGSVIGKAGLRGGSEIGFLVARDFWGKGIAREAVSAVLKRAFANGVECVVADADPRNAGSVTLLMRLGFVKTGEAKNTYKIGDVWSDSVYFEKTAL